MSQIAFIFPGQGAQYIGMGKDFYEQIPAAKEMFAIASKASGLNMEELLFTENEQIHITEYTQVAMLLVEVIILNALQDKGIKSKVNAGLSLGEYGALVASRALTPSDAFQIVRQRGILMQEAVPTGGAMAAVMGMEGEQICKICETVEGVVSVANYNCPGQIVITGEEEAVNSACEKLKEAGAKRTVMLKVSGPFHSKLLKGAGEKLGAVLDHVEIKEIEIPYVSNVSAEYIEEKQQIKELLKKQVYSSVRWQQSVEKMIENGIDIFIEIGPKKTLSAFMKKINKDVTVFNIENLKDLENVVQILKEKGLAQC